MQVYVIYAPHTTSPRRAHGRCVVVHSRVPGCRRQSRARSVGAVAINGVGLPNHHRTTRAHRLKIKLSQRGVVGAGTKQADYAEAEEQTDDEADDRSAEPLARSMVKHDGIYAKAQRPHPSDDKEACCDGVRQRPRQGPRAPATQDATRENEQAQRDQAYDAERDPVEDGLIRPVVDGGGLAGARR